MKILILKRLKHFRNSILDIRNSLAKQELGFTMVEMLIYMGVFVILLTVFIQLFSSILSTQFESQSTSSISVDSRYILARMNYDISRGQNITSPSLGTPSSSLQFVVGGSSVSYGLSSGNLLATSSAGTNRLNGSDIKVSNLSFTPLGSTSGKFTVLVRFTITSLTVGSGGKVETEDLESTFGNR